MKKLPLLVYLTVLVAALAAIFVLGSQLPERVAAHFNFAGRPDGWMTREQAVWSFLIFAAGFSAFVPTLSYFIRLLPAGSLNVPHKEYWRQPEKHRQACTFLFQSSLWFSALSVLLVLGFFILLVRANQTEPQLLNSVATWLLTAIYLGGLALWIVRLVRYFSAAKTLEPAGT